MVQKGKPRFCIDLHEVNSKTVADRYAIPKQDSIFHGLAKAIYFSIIDANKGYHQFRLSSRSRRFTAFITEDGFWGFWRVPFGLKSAPAHFQLAMDAILGSYSTSSRSHLLTILLFTPGLSATIKCMSVWCWKPWRRWG